MIFFFYHENLILTFLLRFLPDNRTMPSRSVSQLSYSSVGSGSGWGPQYSSSSYLPGPDDSSGEHEQIQLFPFYQSHQGPLSHASQESLNSSNPPPQVLSCPVSFWSEISDTRLREPPFFLLLITVDCSVDAEKCTFSQTFFLSDFNRKRSFFIVAEYPVKSNFVVSSIPVLRSDTAVNGSRCHWNNSVFNVNAGYISLTARISDIIQIYGA